MELLVLFGVLFALLVIGVPVAFSLLAAALACFLAMDIPPIVAVQRVAAGISVFTLMAIPFFIFAGDLMYRAGIAERLVRVADAAIGRVRGGLGIVDVGASMMFGAVSGSAIASASLCHISFCACPGCSSGSAWRLVVSLIHPLPD